MEFLRTLDSGIYRHPQDVSGPQSLAEALRGAHPGYLPSKKRNRQNALPWEVNHAQVSFPCKLRTGYASTAAACRPNVLKSVSEPRTDMLPVRGQKCSSLHFQNPRNFMEQVLSSTNPLFLTFRETFGPKQTPGSASIRFATEFPTFPCFQGPRDFC